MTGKSVTRRTAFADRSTPLVAELTRMADPETRDRAALARLRSATHPGRRLEALAFVVRHIDRTGPLWKVEHAEDAAILMASLFALHPQHRRGASLGAVLGRLNGRDGGGVEERFRALLSCSAEELHVHLRHAVSFIAGSQGSPPIDYVDLHAAIHFWGLEGNHARRNWARSFWTPSASSSSSADDTENAATIA